MFFLAKLEEVRLDSAQKKNKMFGQKFEERCRIIKLIFEKVIS